MVAQLAPDFQCSPSTQYTAAPHPFNDSLAADVILRTPDGFYFYIHSQILSHASPIFSDMFSLPQPQGPTQEMSETRPVVDVTEDSKTLERLLHLCYPVKKPGLDELTSIAPVLNAAIKYEMEWPILLLTRDLLAIVSRYPLSVWAVACRSELEDVAHKAADEILGRATDVNSPTTPLDILQTMMQEQGTGTLDGVCAGDYYRLREYLRLRVSQPSFKLLSTEVIKPRDDHHDPPTLDAFVPSDPSPDVTLQCTDGTQYRTHHLILSLHSTTLRKMIETARGSLPSDAGITAAQSPSRVPVIELDIDPQTLTSMLDVCYHGVSHLTYDVSRLGSLIVASRTYGMAQVERLAKERWDEVAAASDPLQAFFIAIKHRLHDCATVAARKFLRRPIAGSYSAMMESATALSYHRLLEYYRSCARAVSTVLEKAGDDVNQEVREIPNSGYYSSYCYRTIPSPDAMGEYLRGLARRVVDDGPGQNFDVGIPDLLRQSCSSEQSMWPSCTSPLAHGLITAFLNCGSALPQAIADAIAQVALEID